MGAYSDIRQAAETKFNTDWASATQAFFAKENATPPNDAAWVRMGINYSETTQKSMGTSANIHRKTGLIWIQIFTPSPDNSSDFSPAYDDELTQKAADIFASQSITIGTSRIVCRDETINNIGQTGAWFQTNVTVPFYYDEVK